MMIQTKLYVIVHTDIFTYLNTYIILIFLFCYTNVMALFNKFYNTILEQEVLTCKNQKKILSWGQFCCALFFIILNFLLSVTNNIERNRISCRLQLYLDIQKKKTNKIFSCILFFVWCWTWLLWYKTELIPIYFSESDR